MSLETFTNALQHIRLPRSQQDRLSLALGTAAVLGSAFLLPTAYRDYRIFKSYGPGGVPNNILGWMTVRALFQPFGTEMLSTEVYVRRIDAAEGHGRGDEGYLTLSTEQLELRKEEGRPEIGPHVVPQRQVTQIPDEDVMEVRSCDGAMCREDGRMIFANIDLFAQKFRSRFRSFGLKNHHLVKFQRSNLERHAEALFLADHLPITDLATTMQGEIAHIHTGNDHSLHVVMAPADCKLQPYGPSNDMDASWPDVCSISFTY